MTGRLIGPMVVAVACIAAGAGPAQDRSIRVGAKNFTESAVLAELVAQTIEAHTELSVERRLNLGGTMICWGALQSGDIDVYVEYTGTAWAAILGQSDKLTDPLRTFFEVRRRCREQFDVHWLEPFGFDNTYALAMPADKADQLGIRRISDLSAHQQTLRAGFGFEFADRNDGYLGLAATYGLRLANMRTIEHGLAYEAIEAGAIDLMDVYSTDGKLLRFDLRVLEDDRRFFPPYNAAPMVRGEALRAHPEIEAALGRLAFRLADRDAQALNYLVETDGETPAAVARAFLEIAGIVTAMDPAAAAARASLARFRVDRPRPGSTTVERPGFLELLVDRPGMVVQLLLEHLALTAISVLLAIMAAVPLGIAITRRPRLRRLLLGAAGVLQTIPSLALLAFMIPLLGLDVKAAITALFLYALLPILRNTYTGIAGVAPDLVDAAVGMGLRPRQVLWRVQLPLAMRTIMAGIRTATVIGIGVATLAAFIGAGGLGQPIVQGLYLNYNGMILLGAVPAALLAVLADFALGRVELALEPGGRRRHAVV